MAWWITLTGTADVNGRLTDSFCIDSGSLPEARLIAIGYGPIHRIDRIPYPANPRVHGPVVNDCPSFCTQPTRCIGLSSCPREWACDD